MSDQPIVPSFGDDAPTGNKLSIICSKGNLDMAYPGLILGNAALGEGYEVNIFFTFWGFDLVNKATWDKLQFTYLGNTAMHMPGKSWSMPQQIAWLPGMTAMSTKMMRKQLADLDIPEVPEFIEILHESGANLWGCKLSADMMQLTEDDLYEGVSGIISATDFIEMSEGGQIIFI